MYDIEYNGETCREHGVYVTKRPAIPSPVEEVETFRVAGRDGVLTGNRYLAPIDLYVEMNFRAKPTLWSEKYRVVKKWLSGSGKLIQGDDRAYYFKVLSVQLEDAERTIKRFGKFMAHFVCDPYLYRVDGLEEYDIDDERILFNRYGVSHPVYVVTGSGSKTLTVNGNTVTLTINGTTVIDTDRMITYTQDDRVLRNTRLAGDYEDLYLLEGDNTIATTATSVKIIPNWRCI